MSNRREFLGAVAVAGSAAGLVNFAEQARGQRSAGAGIHDWHAHWIGPTVVKLMSQRTASPRYVVRGNDVFSMNRGSGDPPANARPQSATWFDVDLRLRELDRTGVEHQVISWVGGAFEGSLKPEEARPIWRAQNDDLAALVKAHPSRFSALASLPTANVQWAAEELERCQSELGLLGATLPLDAFVTYEGAKSLAPIFAVAQKHRGHILVHRGVADASIPGELPESGATNPYFGLPGSEGGGRGRGAGVVGDYPAARTSLMTSTHLATGVITLALTDFLDPYPDVTVQVAMMGGSIPYVAEQIEFAEVESGKPSSVKNLRRVYLDTGQSGRGPRGVALAAKVLGADRILFGTDFGAQTSIAPYVEAVRSAEISASEKDLIVSGNSRALLKSKGVRAV